MEDKLNYSDKTIEPFAIEIISASYNPIYKEFHWNKKADDFDFVHYDLGIGLEVSVIISANTQKVVAYQNSFRKDINSIRGAKTNENGDLSAWYGGSGLELRRLIIDRIHTKNAKAQKHISNIISECHLCLCIDDGGWFQRAEEFDFLKTINSVSKTIFSKIFIVTSSLFLVYEKQEITTYERKYP